MSMRALDGGRGKRTRSGRRMVSVHYATANVDEGEEAGGLECRGCWVQVV